MNYYEHHLGDYAAATGHLSWDEDMAYTRLLRAYYHHERAIPDGQQYRLARATTPAQRKAVDVVLREFFDLREGHWHQSRADREIARYQDKQQKAKRSAEARWANAPQHTGRNANASPDAMRTHSEGNAPKHQAPNTKHQTPEEDIGGIPPEPPARKRARPDPEPLPAWVDAEAWAGFEAMRKAIRKPLTPAAHRLAVSELAKLRDLGHDPADVLRQSTFRSWAGLFPIRPDNPQQARGSAHVGAMSPHGMATYTNAAGAEKRLFEEQPQ